MLTSTQLQNFTDYASHIDESPFMLVDVAVLKERASNFKELFPGVDLYYALKCFPDVEVVKTLDSLIDGYDIASITEIEALIAQGVDPKRLSYSNPVKAAAAIEAAGKQGVHRFAFQSVAELEKIAVNAPGSAVYVRINVSSAKGSLDFSSKFGVDPAESIDLLKKAVELGLTPLGFTFHVGSQAQEMDAWKVAIEKAHSLMLDAKKAGLDLPELNIGGGYPVDYQEGGISIVEVADVVNTGLAKISQDFPGTRFIAEPGRFLTADCAAIFTTVIGKEERGGIPWLYLDTGTFQSFIELFEFERFIYPVVALKHGAVNQQTATQTYTLTGPTCDSYDTMTRAIELPADIEVGDQLMITMTGAYTLAYGSNFNGFSVPKLIFTEFQSNTPLTANTSAKVGAI